MSDSIQILQTAARGLVEAMKAKGYEKATATFEASGGGANVYLRTSDFLDSYPPDGFVASRGEMRNYACVYGKTVEELSAKALDTIETKLRPRVDPQVAATLGIVEVEPGLWREAA